MVKILLLLALVLIQVKKIISEPSPLLFTHTKTTLYYRIDFSGELLAGFIGCSQRLEYTCIGDTVNTSSRICSMAQRQQVLISEFTYEKVKDRIKAVPIGYRQFKGKQKEVMVYEALGFLSDDDAEK